MLPDVVQGLRGQAGVRRVEQRVSPRAGSALQLARQQDVGLHKRRDGVVG